MALGWKLYTIDWEAPEIQEKIKHTIDFLTRDAVTKQVASPTGVAVERNQATVVQEGMCEPTS